LADELWIAYAPFIGNVENFMKSQYCADDLRSAIVLMEKLVRLAQAIGDVETEIALARARLSFAMALERMSAVAPPSRVHRDG
jgi:hypothetical protein